MRDQQKILHQRLGTLQEETVRVIRELATMQGRVKQEVMEAEDKLENLIAQGEEETTANETTIIKEIEGAKVASQNFISAWRSRKQACVAQDKPQVSVGGLLDKQFGTQFS